MSVVPVFACTRPRTGARRRFIVPLTPATGSTRTNPDRTAGSVHAICRSETSDVAVSRFSNESPEPSTRRTPPSGTPSVRSTAVTAAAPRALVPGPPVCAPSCLRSISAVKLSLSTPM